MKGTTRIGGALGVGILIILGALYVNTTAQSANMTGSAIVAVAPERMYIESKDSDGDGVKDWEEELGTRFTEVPGDKASTTPHNQSTYTPPTTLTGKFSEAFFKDYLDGKVKGVDYSDPTEFIGNAVAAVEKNTASIKHSRLELTIIPTSIESVSAYGNELATTMMRYASHNGSEVDILKAALEKNDETLLAPLESTKGMYTNTIKAALAMQVPDTLVDEHLAFLNACEALATNVSAMQVAFADPLYALARVRNFNEDIKSLHTSFKNISVGIKETGVTYMNDEPGAFFYLFENI